MPKPVEKRGRGAETRVFAFVLTSAGRLIPERRSRVVRTVAVEPVWAAELG